MYCSKFHRLAQRAGEMSYRLSVIRFRNHHLNYTTMTPAQAEAMDAVAHMTAAELKQFAEMLIKELESKIKREAEVKAAIKFINAEKLKRVIKTK